MLLDVVEAKGEDLEDYLKEDFRPIVFLIFVLHKSKLLFLFVDVVDAEQRTGEGRNFSESDQQRFMNLPIGFNEHAAEQHDQSPGWQYRCSD